MEAVKDFVRTLKENEELRDEVRTVILTEEMTRLPAEFRAFAAEQKAFNQEIIEYHRKWERRYNRDTERIRNATAYASAIRELDLMAEDMSMTRVRTLKRKEILDMSKKLAQGARLEGNLRSFAKADIIFVAERNGEERYVPVEVSYTADQRDTDRAIRNAEYLTRLTGVPAFPAVACVNIDNKIQSLIDSGQVHLHELEDTFLPEE